MGSDRTNRGPAEAGLRGSFNSRSFQRMVQIVLVLLISVSLYLLSSYLNYRDLSEADFVTRDICFENPDQDNLLTDQYNESKVFISIASSMKFPGRIDFVEQSPAVLFTKPFLNPETFILRC